MKNSPASSGSKKPVKRSGPPSPQGSISPSISWFNRIDYGILIKKTGELLWNNRRRLVPLCIFLLLTGGQAITGSSSFSGGSGPSGPSNNSSEESWQKTLAGIENQEDIKHKMREFLGDKEKLYTAIGMGTVLIIIVILIVLLFFFLNCYFHLALIRTIFYLDRDKKKTQAAIKEEIRGKWKILVKIRVLFGLMYLAVLLAFLAPAGIFALQGSWFGVAALAAMGLISIIISFAIIGYVFRYSLFYFALAELSVKDSIDKGYDLFRKNWKESLLASVVNFALGIIAGIGIILLILLALLPLALVGGLFWGILYLVMGMSHPWGIGIGVGALAGLILLSFIIFLASIWQGYIVIFWYKVFNELAGCKIEEPCEEVVETIKEIVEKTKEKKPAIKPVAQKEK